MLPREAIEASTNYARGTSCSEDELQKALALSREEEEKRIKELEQRNQNALFDDDFNLIDGPPQSVRSGSGSMGATATVHAATVHKL